MGLKSVGGTDSCHCGGGDALDGTRDGAVRVRVRFDDAARFV